MFGMLILPTAFDVDAAWLHAVVHSVCFLAAKYTDLGIQTWAEVHNDICITRSSTVCLGPWRRA